MFLSKMLHNLLLGVLETCDHSGEHVVCTRYGMKTGILQIGAQKEKYVMEVSHDRLALFN